MILYPEIKPYATHQLKVTAPHELYIEECGSPSGIPILFVHGGPGAGCDSTSRRFFDPERYRIILFDQRGCGKSTPFAELDNNTTQDLVNDIEAIRTLLNIDRWLLFGGSWGTTLSLAYAQSHPDRVRGMILRGVFLCREQDLQWFYQKGASLVFPDHWQDYIHPIPEAEHSDFISAFHKRLTGKNELARMAAAKAWSLWEAHCATLTPNHKVVDYFSNPHMAIGLASIECHYFVNKAFLKPNQLIGDIDKIKNIPATVIHGRYDMVCPIDNAYTLKRAWGKACQLQIIREAGHSASEPAIVDALIRATRDMADWVEAEDTSI